MINVRLMIDGDMENYLRNFPESKIQTEICMCASHKLVGGSVVAIENDTVIGMGGLLDNGSEYHAWVSTAPILRKKIVFLYRALAKALDAVCADYHPVYVTISPNNVPTKRLAEMLGFTEAGERDGEHLMVRAS